MREKASFLERELREQVAAAHEFMEEERRQRRAAEASLARQLAEARADASALRACLATAGDTQQQQEVVTAAPPQLSLHMQCGSASHRQDLHGLLCCRVDRRFPEISKLIATFG